jgi:D-psicose/D-tagatose/L-ribulose 3-epimerase
MPHVHEQRERIAIEAATHGLAILCATGLTPDLDVSSPDPVVRRAGIEYLKRCLSTAAELGSPIMGGVTFAPWFDFPEDDLESRRQRSAESLREAAGAADAVGVDLCVEVLNRFETFMFNTVEQTHRFLDLVDHPSVKIELDTFHMNMEEGDLAGAVRSAGDRLGYFQCAANNRAMPGKGHIDWTALGGALDDIAYTRPVVVETFPNPDVETGRSTHAFRPLVGDLMAEARESADFLRTHLGGAPAVEQTRQE